MAYEGLTAFFLEAGFLGVLLFGRSRVPPWAHFLASVMVAAGTLASAFWILAVNSTVVAFYITTALVVAGVAAYHLRGGRFAEEGGIMLKQAFGLLNAARAAAGRDRRHARSQHPRAPAGQDRRHGGELGNAELGISIWPMVVPYTISLWATASASKAQAFLVIGTVFLLPIIVMYTGWSYWVFRGKVKADAGYHH